MVFPSVLLVPLVLVSRRHLGGSLPSDQEGLEVPKKDVVAALHGGGGGAMKRAVMQVDTHRGAGGTVTFSPGCTGRP